MGRLRDWRKYDNDLRRGATPPPNPPPDWGGYRTLADLTAAARIAGYRGGAGARHAAALRAYLATHGDPQRAAVRAALDAERHGEGET